MEMTAQDLLPFDPQIVPWETTPNDWALCLVPEPACRVWVEHALIRTMLESVHLNPDNVANIRSMFTTIGGKVAVVLHQPKYALEDGEVREIRFTGNPVVLRAGRFGGEIFTFLPRPELETTRAQETE